MIDARRSNQKWIFWLLLIVVAFYLIFTLNWLINNHQQRHKLDTTLDALPLLLPIQHLTQQLQAERGMLSGFATQQLPSRPPIELQQLQTDAAWRNFALALADNETATSTFQQYFSTLLNQQQLFLLRQQVLEMQLGSTEVKLRYTSILQPLLDFAEYMQQKNELASLNNALSAILSLTQALERAGQERATLHIAFAEQQMSPSRYQSFVILVNEQMDYLKQFASVSLPQIQEQWLTVQSHFENGAFIELREQALVQQFDGDAALWFALATTRIDKIYQLRAELCQLLQQQALSMEQQLEQTAQQLWSQLESLLLVFLLLVWRLYRLHCVPGPRMKQIRHSPQF